MHNINLADHLIYSDGFIYWKTPKQGRKQCNPIGLNTKKERYRRVTIDGKELLQHRVIFTMFYGYCPKYIDHIDGDIHNNKIENLREATSSENMANSVKTRGISNLKGVMKEPTGKYSSRICVNRKRLFLGTFPTEEDAHNAYKKASIEHFGEFSPYYQNLKENYIRNR